MRPTKEGLRALGVSIALVCASYVPAHAQDDAAAAPVPAPSASSEQAPAAPAEKPAAQPATWGLNGTFGYGGAGGDFGNLFRNPLPWEYNFFRTKGAWRAGIGLTFSSFKMKEPYEKELEWGYQEINLFGTRMFNLKGPVRPYLTVRGGVVTLRPRSDLFTLNPLPPDYVSGNATKKRTTGFNVGVIPGLEWRLGRGAYLDTALGLTYFKVGEYDLSPVGQPPRSSGTSWTGRLGVTWFPNGEQPGYAEQAGPRDAWGVKKSYGWAIGEVLAINNLGGVASTWLRDVDWSETSPRSWWANIKGGLAYDTDAFKTNQFIHPFNGAAYYNSGRANGLSFWPSAGLALFGAYQWEVSGETGPASLNDMFATALGGITVGAFQYRTSSEILNNQSRGWGRFGRELGAFIVDPVRGFNRLVRGDAKAIADNPTDPMDFRPGGFTYVGVGTRTYGEGNSLTNNSKTYPMIFINHTYSDIYDATRRKPMDWMYFDAEVNIGGVDALQKLSIRGAIASWPLGQAHNHVLGIMQYYEYRNNFAYTFGGQSTGAALFSRFWPDHKWSVRTRVDAFGTWLGAVNSEYAKFAVTGDTENVRQYDYGPGYGFGGDAALFLNKQVLLAGRYWLNYIDVTNGSTYTRGTIGGTGTHYLQYGLVRFGIPLRRSINLGADLLVFQRDSHFTVTNSTTGVTGIQDVHQRNPQLKVYIAFSDSGH